jgi:hypothetical protein
MNTTDLEAVAEHQEALKKTPHWKLPERWRTDIGTSI